MHTFEALARLKERFLDYNQATRKGYSLIKAIIPLYLQFKRAYA